MHQKKASSGKKGGSGLNELHIWGMKVLPVHTPEGAQMTSVIALPHSDPARLLEESCFYGPTKLNVAVSVRKHKQIQDKHPVRAGSMDTPAQASAAAGGWEGDTPPLPCSTRASVQAAA